MSNDAVRGRSLLRSAPGMVLFAIALADVMRTADTDLWAHIYFGRVVLSQHQFLFHAPSSYACPPGPRNWPNLEWLGGVVMAFVYDAAGVVGLKLAKLVCIAAMMVLIAFGEGETGASLEVQAVVLLVAGMAFVPQMLAALMTMLARETYGVRRPGLRCRCLHCGSICTAGTATLAALLNPYGLNDWLTVNSYLRNPFTFAYVSEFHSMFAMMAQLYREDVPGALAFMRRHGLHGNTLCAYPWADYLIWHDAPNSNIFIESLFEAYYPATVQDDYLAFEEGSSRAAEMLNAYPHDFILFTTQSPPTLFMATRGAWKLIYRDPVSSLFARADSPAARGAGVPMFSQTAPSSFFP